MYEANDILDGWASVGMKNMLFLHTEMSKSINDQLGTTGKKMKKMLISAYDNKN